MPDRYHFKTDVLHRPVSLHAQMFLSDNLIILPCLHQRCSQCNEETFTRHLQDIERGLARRRLKVRSRSSAKLEYFKSVVYQHTRRSEARHNNSIGLAKRIRLISTGFSDRRAIDNFSPMCKRSEWKIKSAPRARGLLRIEPVLLILCLEQISG